MSEPPTLRGSASFMEFHEHGDEEENSSPDPHGAYRLTTPHPPDVAASRWNTHGSRWGAHTAGASTAGESELSGAATARRFGSDLDSPAVRSTASMERKVPSCPQKQGSHQQTKRHTLPPVGLNAQGFDLEGEEIKPRHLDLGDSDPVNTLSLSPMNLVGSPASPPSRPASKQNGMRVPLEQLGHDRRGKRMRVGNADQEFGIFSVGLDTDNDGVPSLSRENSSGSSENHRMPPPLQHHNSMIDTKVLFERNDWFTTSFSYDDGFEWGPFIGSGSFSDVYSVRHKSRPEEMYAIKVSKRKIHSRKERAEFLREVELANNMPSHPNVVEYFRAWQDSLIFYVQMELCQDGTLRHLMQREQGAIHLPAYEPRLWEIVLHIARGLAHIHAFDVVHCDIKPDNILVSADGLFKIGDLGHATFIKAWDEQEGDAKYLSRDLLESKPSTKADIFSFGIMIYEIKSGEELPGKGPQWEYLRNGSVPLPSNCSVLLGGLVQRSMHPQPESRPTAQDIIDTCCNVQMQAALAMSSQA